MFKGEKKISYPESEIAEAAKLLNTLPEIELIQGVHIRNDDELKDIIRLKNESPDSLVILLTGGRLKYATPLRDPEKIAQHLDISLQDPRIVNIIGEVTRLAPLVKADDQFDLKPFGINRIFPFYYFYQDIDLVFVDSTPGHDDNWRGKNGEKSRTMLDYVHVSPSAVIWYGYDGSYFDDVRDSLARIKF